MLAVSEADITPAVVMLASSLLRAAHPLDASLHNALTKAEVRLFTHAWRVDGGILRIESEANVGKFWETDGDYCECPTKKYTCWHVASFYVLSVLAAANIAPLKAHSAPQYGTHGPLDDPASLGNFLDRPEIAGELDDVSFTEPAGETSAEHAARVAFETAPKRLSNSERRKLAYDAARAVGAPYSAAEIAATRAHTLAYHQAHPKTSPPPPPPSPLRSSKDDRDRRRALSKPTIDAPVLWDTADYAEEKAPEKLLTPVKEHRFHSTTGNHTQGVPDPFDDLF